MLAQFVAVSVGRTSTVPVGVSNGVGVELGSGVTLGVLVGKAVGNCATVGIGSSPR